MSKSQPYSHILEVSNLKQHFVKHSGIFNQKKTIIRAVDGVDFSIKLAETLSLVGESGCGKSTLGRTILRLLEPTSGKIIFEGDDITNLNPKELIKLRRKMQIIFQDPFASLNPRMSVGEIIEEALIIHKLFESKEDRQKRVLDLLNLVGLRKESSTRYPHEFSGGQRQRIGIARALAVEPRFIVCDEPISALDVSIQAQIINLLLDLQEQFGLTFLFIAHDLHVVKHMSNRTCVMYLGNIVEKGNTKKVFNHPKHPYTQALISAVPVPDPKRKINRILLSGEIPSPINPPLGCKFNTRCPKVMPKCKAESPPLIKIEEDQEVACFLYN